MEKKLKPPAMPTADRDPLADSASPPFADYSSPTTPSPSSPSSSLSSLSSSPSSVSASASASPPPLPLTPSSPPLIWPDTPSNAERDEKALFVIKYGHDTREDLGNQIVSQGGDILAYVAKNAVLVYGPSDAVHNAVRNTNSLMGTYEQDVKVADAITSADGPLADPTRISKLLQQLNTWQKQPNPPTPPPPSQRQQQEQPQQPPSSPQQSVMERRSTISSEAGYSGNTSRGGDNISASSEPRPDLYGLHVQVVPGLESEGVRRIYHDQLGSELGRRGDGDDACWPRMRMYDRSRWLVVYLCLQDLERGIRWMAAAPTTVWIEPQLRAQPANTRAALIIQTGTLTDSQYLSSSDTSEKPFWKAGLMGNGQIIGMADTGINFYSCFLSDSNYAPSDLLNLFHDDPPRYFLPNHRKVVQYVLPSGAISSPHQSVYSSSYICRSSTLPIGVTNPDISDYFGDSDDMHGTHVAGTLVGSVWDESGLVNSVATGAAPMAQLSFVDMTAQSLPNELMLPPQLDVDLLPQFDRFAWRNPDVISCVAAGNHGRNFGVRPNVQAPGTAKNVLSVGASLNHPKSQELMGDQTVPIFQYMDTNRTVHKQAHCVHIAYDPHTVFINVANGFSEI
ncbi:hypothetical protein VOLCADRAFT_95171 [Volvox carteri f. nagariensis]|uniref:Peptidase S8/S53 domain-containing protein n=1 Tax=Volvox carteri f. nagariensis TaxID=3068 RepID=D8U6T0_VOLCA|nr:uncharacterized protein VOLCADRAFT_95171 [Volvox carteri f. nagariensis]EFJ44565.1 hypothetical protein VOLCADRAFT_95171 [Volvox carteri f. nagariensis]|eukprot:XP_002954415.1 hypothetical protein VOLCADRAFT_95171 [Volvox carteri f. nagariensis]